MLIIGVDEVGRGCWAGPLVAGAVLLHSPIPGLKDSKKLSKATRERLSTIINAEALVGLGWVWPNEIDAMGLTAAVRTAMERAVAEISDDYDEIIVDGNFNFLAGLPKSRALIKADDSEPAVSAASIAAKVARDAYMATTAHTSYPAFGFDRHVGYGTKLHADMMAAYGVTPLHRMSFKPVKSAAGAQV